MGRARRPPDIALGDVAAAAEALGRAQSLHAQVGERALELQLAWTEGDLALLRGDLDAAGAHYGAPSPSLAKASSPVPRCSPCSAWHASTSAAPIPARAIERAREAAAIAARGELGSLLPLARLIEAEAHAAVGGTKEAEAGLARLAAAFARGGRARRGPLRAAGGAPARRRHAAALLTRAAALAVRHRADLIGWLGERGPLDRPLLAPLLDRHGVEALLVDLGEGVRTPLSTRSSDPRTRLTPSSARPRPGDVRARRPLQRWSRTRRGGGARGRGHGAGRHRPAGPPALQVRLLGRFELQAMVGRWTRRRGRRRKARALVKLLLLHRPGGLHDEQLIEWLWPEHDVARGRAASRRR